ncbi:MAG TPA: NrfD/PsrC family molybdoenzyme membrane anchor subunit [Symbiobacteriaceae bacterium]|nr:NrfD/PsrC family molybdoenzyme membrane anchor subunit [Symbiobacteriaceae bacterium]
MTVLTGLQSPGARPGVRAGWYAALGLTVLGGGAAVLYRILGGLSTTYLTSQMPWGAWVAFYIYFVGLSAGAFLLSSLIYVFGMVRFEKVGRMALLTALVCMIVALAFIGLDLGRVDRALTPLLRFNVTSPLAWEVRFYVVYIALLAAELWLSVRARPRDHQWLRILGTIGIPIAIFGVHGGTGTIFAVVKARGIWFGPLFPVVFILSALVSGTALLTLFYAVRQVARRRPVDTGLVVDLGKLLLGFLLVDLGLFFYEMLVPLLSGNPHEQEVIHTMISGRFAWSFWIVQVGMAFIAPAVILLSGLKRSWKWVALAAASTVVGIVGVRFNIVVPAQIPPLLPGLPAGDYLPSLVEWASSAGLIALGLLLFSLAAERLPLDTDGGAAHDER